MRGVARTADRTSGAVSDARMLIVGVGGVKSRMQAFPVRLHEPPEDGHPVRETFQAVRVQEGFGQMNRDPEVLGPPQERHRLARERLPVRLLGRDDGRPDLLLGPSLRRLIEGGKRRIPIFEVGAARIVRADGRQQSLDLGGLHILVPCADI
jgi:hypothetical protein